MCLFIALPAVLELLSVSLIITFRFVRQFTPSKPVNWPLIFSTVFQPILTRCLLWALLAVAKNLNCGTVILNNVDLSLSLNNEAGWGFATRAPGVCLQGHLSRHINSAASPLSEWLLNMCFQTRFYDSLCKALLLFYSPLFLFGVTVFLMYCFLLAEIHITLLLQRLFKVLYKITIRQ